MAEFEKIKVPSVREAFVQAIEDKIFSGELHVGDRLPPARELCSIMGVSLTIVNAGISELVSKGFVEVRPRHGTYVADYKTRGNAETLAAIMRYNGGKLNAHDVRSFCESRIALDPFVAELVLERANDAQLRSLGEILNAMKAETDVAAFCALITDFYTQLYSFSDNTILTLLYHSTVNPQRGMYEVFVRQNGRDIILENTEQVYRALLARDLSAAQTAMREGLHAPLRGPTAII